VEEREVGASEYQGSRNREIGLALSAFQHHLFKLSFSEQRLDYEGFPNQRMDMVSSVPDPADPAGLAHILDKDKPANVMRRALRVGLLLIGAWHAPNSIDGKSRLNTVARSHNYLTVLEVGEAAQEAVPKAFVVPRKADEELPRILCEDQRAHA